MNCEECSQFISIYLDGELDEPIAIGLREHLAACTDCAKLCEDFAAIIDACESDDTAELMPPNSQALWCRINNLIESEIKPEPPPVVEEQRRRIWQLSFAQLAAGFLGIAVISSLLTIVGIKNYNRQDPDDLTRSSSSQTTFERIASRLGLMDTPQQARDRRIKEQQAAIEYWNARVQVRRAQWDRNMREAFDRNLNEIDQAVNEYQVILQQDPQDDLSGEMLDSALSEKMNLLREFSDL
jgi:Putative zinc-finger